MMLVFEDGHTEGTIGGGAVEYAAQNHARDLLKNQSSDTVGYCLNKNDVANLGMICGGAVSVFFGLQAGLGPTTLLRPMLDAVSPLPPASVAALCTMIPGTLTDAAGLALIAVAYAADKLIFKPGPKEA